MMPRPSGRYFEEFALEDEFASPARTVTETDVTLFAGLSGDYNPLHTDAEFARETPYGQRIAHGLLGLSIASGLAARAGFIEGTVLAFMGLSWKFKEPLLFGDTIHITSRVKKTRPLPSMGGGMVVFDVAVINQHAITTQEGEWTLLVKSQPQA